MTRRRIAAAVAREVGTTRAQTERVIGRFLDEVIAELEEHGRVELRGFGVFKIAELPEHEGFNPHTRERTQQEARRFVRFKASRLVVDQLNSEADEG